MKDLAREKHNAAKASLAFIKTNMIVGLGSGSTAELMIQELGKLVTNGLGIKAIPSSRRTAELARSLNIELTSLSEVQNMDLYIDGADEIDPQLNMIKGGGGALLREKILAYNSSKNIFIIDSSKRVEKLGRFKLPVEVIPFAQQSIMLSLTQRNLTPVLRKESALPFKTDENNFIIDIDIWNCRDLTALNTELLAIPGVVETGLFLNYVDVLITGVANEGKMAAVQTFERS